MGSSVIPELQAKLDHADLQAKLDLAEEALRRSEERATAGQLALEVMHDVRNPLEALGYLVYLTLEDAGDSERVRHHMQLAEEQVVALREIAGGTLRLARVSTARRPADLAVLAEAALRMHRHSIEVKGVRLVKDIRGELVAEVHTGEILQVISNLMTNALDATPDNGTLSLRLRKCQGRVRIVVADNGHGIPREIIGNIFKPFFTTKDGRGTGLGLSLSKKIIDHHNGTIRLRSSVRPGKTGTIFQVSLPAA